MKTLLFPLILLMAVNIGACQKDSTSSNTATSPSQGLPASQQSQSPPAAGVNFNARQDFPSLSDQDNAQP